MTPPSGNAVYAGLKALVQASGLAFVIHKHEPTRTMDDAAQNLSLDVTRIVKTVAFKTRDGRLVLAALRGVLRVDYGLLARLAGVNRRDLCALAPQEVPELLGVEPGSVSPLVLGLTARVFLDADVLRIAPTAYCGLGRPDRTLEMAPADLLRLSGAELGMFSR